jgi:hypothetical protein
MGVMIRSLLKGSALAVWGAVLSFVGYHIGQELKGTPAPALLVGASVTLVGGAWWWTQRTK